MLANLRARFARTAVSEKREVFTGRNVVAGFVEAGAGVIDPGYNSERTEFRKSDSLIRWCRAGPRP